MYQIKCKIEGLVPLLMCRYIEKKDPTDRGKTVKGASDRKTILEAMVYKDKNGMYLPANNIRMMLIGNRFRKGAAYIQGTYRETKKGTEYTSFCSGCVWVEGEKDKLKVYFEPVRKSWDAVDIRSFTTKDGSRKMIERPMIETPWSLTFIITIVEDTFDQGKIREFFETGGLRCGLGVFGPTFGRFRIVDWKIL